MTERLERFFNWQSDSDWFWGPLLYLRPARHVRMTFLFWLKMIGIIALFAVPIGAILGSLLVYYDYTTVAHHDLKIPPVIVTENWINQGSPQVVLSNCAWLIAFGISGCFCQHWAWNRRADRLNREAALMPPTAVEVASVWPPPPAVPVDGNTMC